ncbi:F-box protein At1g67340-like [Cynara cardunculus var. scolymus]|uniref:F-box domain, cyclin-like protein n=1 Tax=Cynara cardunculus var. scolymus TaxID=59895 RepID=A0A103XVU6_CYNCS|nr:F-box protein At1g67340-like [Cynara cardunculus var. scolymus]KVH97829.1 F-box domain, cyclin-like protein [Cynara cardunculus var. scolymus]
MRTRRGICYPEVNTMCYEKRRRDGNLAGAQMILSRKRLKSSSGTPVVNASSHCDFFDTLPDDIVLSILAKLGSTVGCPADFISVLSTCKRFNGLGLHSLVLSKASSNCFAVKAKKWSESSHRFLKRCSDAGNAEASYTLGMIRFYCLQNRGGGASFMAKAAIRSHAPALYSLAVIQFNGSGGLKNDKDLRAGVALCARAAFLGHIDALRELGHCLQDGYGVSKNIAEGRRLLIQANARELATVLSTTPATLLSGKHLTWNPLPHLMGPGCPLLSDFGCNVPAPTPHPANQFLSDWFSDKPPCPELRLCSHGGCGRPETRRHEFRRCSVCGDVNYCSRACQALDWKLRHKAVCRPGVDNGGFNGNVNENDIMVVER